MHLLAKRGLVGALALAVGLSLSATRARALEEIVTLNTDFSTGSVSTLGVNSPWPVTPDRAFVCGDAVARTAFGLVFVVNRFGCDNIQVLDPAQGWATVAEYSVGVGTNPQDIAVLSLTRAYLTRYDSNDLLEINPMTGSVLGSVSLASMLDVDDWVDMHRMFVQGNFLYVQLQRLDRRSFPWVPIAPSYLAVLDLATRQLVDLNGALPGAQGIPLAGTNPINAMQLELSTGALLVPEAGAYGTVNDGGIERVDLAQRRSVGFLATGAQLGGDVVDFAQSPQRVYAVVADPSFVTRAYALHPVSGNLLSTVYDAEGYDLSDCLVTRQGHLFLADRDFVNPGVRVYDAATGAPLAGPLVTGLPPFELLSLTGTTSDAPIADASFLEGLAFPNPSRGAVELSFARPLEAASRVEVIDAGGRVLRTLFATAGEASIVWDGRDEEGHSVPVGAYWFRARGASGWNGAIAFRRLGDSESGR